MNPKRRIIPIFVPHLGCPNDCVFCNQRRISGERNPATAETVLRAVDTAGEAFTEDMPSELAFYGGSFTAIPEGEQEELLSAAQGFLKRNKNNSIRVSTRPDCIDAAAVERLGNYGVAVVELGVQSMCGDVLAASRRGHSPYDVVRAADIIKKSGLGLIIQMMTGLPGDSKEKALYTARRIIGLKPDGVRIYPSVIVRDTELFDMWQRGEYIEHTVEEAVPLCAEICGLFREAEIPVIRLGLNPTEELTSGGAVGGAYHPAFGELVYSEMYLNEARRALSGIQPGASVVIGVSKGRVSMMTGQHRRNIEALTREFSLKTIKIIQTEIAFGKIRVIED